MKSTEIRQFFLDYFKKKGHKIVQSAPLVVKDDPTLMFTNAGMNQFKDFFLGTKDPVHTRVVDTQKCLRVSGKHNDLEEVGLDTYHHTMFEMLGNWSFGDYFKKEAIQWAWELLTEIYELPKDRLYVTVFGGDKADGLEKDDEARDLWQEILPKNRVIDGSKKDNFWEMGETGPCGPCSEIHIDLRSKDETKAIHGSTLVNSDHPQVVEIWNLVFIQFNRKAGGILENLPAKHVDTGMGFERLAMAIQQKLSNYDTDVFSPLINQLAEKAGVRYGENDQKDIALRVIVDHIRAIAFAIADGQLPSNTGAGYVIRRILRRAVRYGFQFLKFNKPFLTSLLPVLSKQFQGVFPELINQREFIEKVINEEETNFLRTLELGLRKLYQIKDKLINQGSNIIPGEIAFELYDTFGFPYDLTSLIARENKLEIDKDGFVREMDKQKKRSKTDAVQETGDWTVVGKSNGEGFVGYEQLMTSSHIERYRSVKQKGKVMVQLVLNTTPFYAESGGQVGDSGTLVNSNETINILDTKKENELIVHIADKMPADPNAKFDAKVNVEKRTLTMNNHSATHLMHAALRQVLGTHVEQRGSFVNHKLLRFDFSHFTRMTDEEIEKVENIVNAKIRENIPLIEKRNVPIERAKQQGAMALFGEKYGELVRMIIFDKDYSIELCGGTHVSATGQVGLFKITSESSIAAGVRRIEAITAVESERFVRQQGYVVNQIAGMLKNPKDLVQSVTLLSKEKADVEKELNGLKKEKIRFLKEDLLAKLKKRGSVNCLIEKVSVSDTEGLKQLGFEFRNQIENLFMVLAAEINKKPQIAVVLSDSIIKSHNLHAGDIVKSLASSINGGGGGQSFFATAGGSDIKGLDEVIKKASKFINKLIL